MVAQGWTIGGVTVAGAGLPLTRINEDIIKAWGAWCDAHTPALRYNAIVDGSQKTHDILVDIARAGRAPRDMGNGEIRGCL